MTGREYEHIIYNLADLIYNRSSNDSVPTKYYTKGLITAYLDILRLDKSKNYVNSLLETLKNEHYI